MRRRARVITELSGPSATRQSEKDSCDINIMVSKMLRGQAVNLAYGPGAYGDFSNVGDFQDTREQIKEAETDFAALPSKIRKQFDNDVENLLAAFDDPDQANQLREMGLIPTDEVEEPRPADPAPVTPPATAPEPEA